MQALRQIRIGARLGLAFAAVLLLLSLLGGYGIYQLGRVNFYAEDLGTNWLPSVKVLGDLRSSLNQGRRFSLGALLESTPEAKLSQEKNYEELVQSKLPKLFSDYEALITSTEEQQAFNDAKASWQAYVEQTKKIMALSNGSDADRQVAKELAMGDAAKSFSEALKLLSRDIEINAAGADQATAASQRSYRDSVMVFGVVIVLSVVVGAVLAVVVTRSIVQPLGAGVRIAEAVADGDLTTRFQIEGRDESADLLRALQHMNDRLLEMVRQVRLSSDSIATGSEEIAIGNTDLSQRTEEQASNLEQTAASMEELASTVKANAETAVQASQLAMETAQAVEQGGATMDRVVATMQEISSSSKKIADIIAVIDGIAFQTNILALNAAVEAARAGEQGRGFAVVAGEVRSLAGRSSEASREIRSLISASVEKVEHGAALVDEAGSNITYIVSQVQHVSTMIKEISSASSEQSIGISQVGDAVHQLDQVTQQNAALVEESAAAADSLKNQSKRLAELVSVFKLTQA